MENLISGIYKIEDFETGAVYVGSSKNIKKRWSNHLAKLRTDKHSYTEFQDAWNIDNNRIKFEILEECNADNLESMENYFIGYCSAIDGWTIINKRIIAKRAKPVADTSNMVKAQTGSNNGHCTLSDEEVAEIRKALSEGVKPAFLSEKYGVSGTHIYRLKEGQRRGIVVTDE